MGWSETKPLSQLNQDQPKTGSVLGQILFRRKNGYNYKARILLRGTKPDPKLIQFWLVLVH